MFFMSKKRFEEAVSERVMKAQDKMWFDHRLDEMSQAHYRFADMAEKRLAMLEQAVFNKQPECAAEMVKRVR